VRKTFWRLVAVLTFTGVAQGVHAQAAPPVRVTLSGRAQIQLSSTSVDEEEAGTTGSIAGSMFETRRIRLQVNVAAGDWIRGIIEPDFAMSSLRLKQAWIALDFDPAFSIRAGQFKKPFSLILLSSSTQIAPIERGVRIRNLEDALNQQDATRFGTIDGETIVGEEQALVTLMQYGDYDIGAAIEGEKAGFEWSLGVFNGAGESARDVNDSKTFTGRVTYGLPVSTPVRIGVSASHRDAFFGGAEVDTRKGTAYMLDLEVGEFRNGLWLMAEALRGENLVTEETLMGAQAMLSYFISTGGTRRIEGVEPVGRVSWGDPDDAVDGDAGILLTPGVNLYMFGRNRLMFNWDVFMPQGDAFSTQHAMRAQLNLHF
jgi:hypothetical protein